MAAVMCAKAPLRFGRMYFREISDDRDGELFGLPFGTTYTLAFSRMLYASEVLFAYNVSLAQRQDFVVVDADLHADGAQMNVLYRSSGSTRSPVTVRTAANGTRNVHLDLAPREVVILA